MSLKVFSRLPSYYQHNPLFSHLIEHIIHAKVMTSVILYTRGGEDFLLRKDGIIHAPLDW
jgi:hypothetical protein